MVQVEGEPMMSWDFSLVQVKLFFSDLIEEHGKANLMADSAYLLKTSYPPGCKTWCITQQVEGEAMMSRDFSCVQMKL